MTKTFPGFRRGRGLGSALVFTAFLTSSTLTFGQSAPSNGLAAYWSFDSANLAGNQASDLSGNGLTANLYGGVGSVAGQLGQALRFGGGNGYATDAAEPHTDLTNDVSLSLWVQTTNAQRSEGLISRYSAAGMESGYLLRSLASGHIEVRIGGKNLNEGLAQNFTDSGKAINDGQWHHIGVVMQLGQGVTFYIDGAQSTQFLAGIKGGPGNPNLMIGLNPWMEFATYLTGSLDEVRIYKRALNASEVAQLAQVQAPTPVPPNLAVSATSLTFNGTVGGSGATQSLNISNSGGGTMTWNVSSDQPWLTVSPASGTNSGSVTVTAAPGSLTAGTQTGTLTVTGSAGTSSSPQKVAVTFTVADAPAVSSGMAAYWTFDTANIGNGQAFDLSGNNLTATLRGGASTVAGVAGQSIYLDGARAYLTVGNEVLTDSTSSLSLALWIRTANSGRTEAIVSRYNAAGMESGYLLRTNPSGHLEVRVGGNNLAGGVAQTFVDSGKAVNDGSWHHIAAILTLAQGISFYVDGTNNSTVSANLVARPGSNNLQIGLNPWAEYGTYFTGMMDDFHIYRRVLSSSEVAQLANLQVPPPPPPPPPPPVTPVLSISSTSLSFAANAGASAASQSLSVSNTGGGTMTWTVGSNQPWLTVSPASGTNAGTVSVNASASTLAAGTYSATVTVSAAGATGSPKTVSVNFAVATAIGPPPPPSGNARYAAPNGTSSGDGSISKPWDLITALSPPSSVRPGDTIYLRGGTYGTGTSVYNSYVTGTSAAPIVIKQYPGERATINGGIAVYGSYSWFWGFEITNLYTINTNRVINAAGSNASLIPMGINDYAPNNKFINMIVHDTQQGIGFWSAGAVGEIYGSVIYNNGWQGSDRGHGHGIYTQNSVGTTKTISDNIIYGGFGLGIQAYGSGAAYIQDYVLDGNTIFNSGVLSYGHHDYNVLFAGGHRPQNIKITNTYTYHTPTDGTGLSAFDWPASGSALNLTSTNNYWIGGQTAIQLYNWVGATFTQNVAYTAGSNYTLVGGALTPSGYNWDYNTYYGSNTFVYGSANTFTGWKQATGLDSHSSYTAGRPTGIWTFVRPNKYETGRGNVTIYNWDLAPSVAVDLSGVVTVGKPFVIKNAQDYFGNAVVSGTYAGGKVNIPMTGLTMEPAHGGVPTQPKSPGPEFGAFVVIQQ